jgi:murein endopeptidase
MTKSLIVISLLAVAFASGCGVLNTLNPFLDDEEAGTPVRPLDEHAPGGEDLPTPAEATKMNPEGNIFSSIGFYSHGKLWSNWPVKDNEFWVVRPRTTANRMNFMSFYAWEPMHEAAIAYFTAEPDADRWTLWDMSWEFGGKKSGHISHQLGLDADLKLVYLDGAPEKIDNLNYSKLWTLAVSFVGTGKVQRILTDAAIKKKLCAYSKTSDTPEPLRSEVLMRLRPWPGHTDHLHIRFYCDEIDKLCVPQTEPPKGSGC